MFLSGLFCAYKQTLPFLRNVTVGNCYQITFQVFSLFLNVPFPELSRDFATPGLSLIIAHVAANRQQLLTFFRHLLQNSQHICTEYVVQIHYKKGQIPDPQVVKTNPL